MGTKRAASSAQQITGADQGVQRPGWTLSGGWLSAVFKQLLILQIKNYKEKVFNVEDEFQLKKKKKVVLKTY